MPTDARPPGRPRGKKNGFQHDTSPASSRSARELRHDIETDEAYKAQFARATSPQLGSGGSTPKLNDRRAVLMCAIRRQPGEWTTCRVQRLYRALGIAVFRSTARDDLQFLARAGLLDLHDTPDRRFFTLPHGGAS